MATEQQVHHTLARVAPQQSRATRQLLQVLQGARPPLALESGISKGQPQRGRVQFQPPPVQIEPERQGRLEQGGGVGAGADGHLHHPQAMAGGEALKSGRPYEDPPGFRHSAISAVEGLGDLRAPQRKAAVTAAARDQARGLGRRRDLRPR